jgi:hypothetical protein
LEPERASASPPQISLWLLGLLGILGVASWFRSQANTPSQQAVEPVQAGGSTDRNGNVRKNENGGSTGAVTVTEVPESKAKHDRARKRRQKIQRLRKAGGAWLSLGTFLVILFYTLIARNQWEEMIKATYHAARVANTAQKQLEASERPWLKITDVQTRSNSKIIPALSFQASPNWPAGTQQTTFQLDIAYKNIGRSVATVTVDFQLFLPLWKDGYSDVILADEKKFCDSVARINPTPGLSVINFPGDEPYH